MTEFSRSLLSDAETYSNLKFALYSTVIVVSCDYIVENSIFAITGQICHALPLNNVNKAIGLL